MDTPDFQLDAVDDLLHSVDGKQFHPNEGVIDEKRDTPPLQEGLMATDFPEYHGLFGEPEDISQPTSQENLPSAQSTQSGLPAVNLTDLLPATDYPEWAAVTQPLQQEHASRIGDPLQPGESYVDAPDAFLEDDVSDTQDDLDQWFNAVPLDEAIPQLLPLDEFDVSEPTAALEAEEPEVFVFDQEESDQFLDELDDLLEEEVTVEEASHKPIDQELPNAAYMAPILETEHPGMHEYQVVRKVAGSIESVLRENPHYQQDLQLQAAAYSPSETSTTHQYQVVRNPEKRAHDILHIESRLQNTTTGEIYAPPMSDFTQIKKPNVIKRFWAKAKSIFGF